MNEDIRQDISHNHICLNFHTLKQISCCYMDIFHTSVELNIFLSDTNRHIIQVIGENLLGT
ncbi:Uncharacterised protein [Streptococcus pneumoniae]|nr:Uncharacterised protein [Streptococcus pneumoniae]